MRTAWAWLARGVVILIATAACVGLGLLGGTAEAQDAPLAPPAQTPADTGADTGDIEAPETQTATEARSAEARFSLSVTHEASWYAGRDAGQSLASALVLVQPAFAWRSGERWRVAANLTGLGDANGHTEGVLRVREAYASASLGGWDLIAGKKMVRWGTGYAFAPTGVLDPPRRPTDPADRLNLNEGRELVGFLWVRGRHALTGAWASAGLVGEKRPGMRETGALRYNVLVHGFDTSLVYAHERGGFDVFGLNFTSVLGSALEVHGELSHRRGREALSVTGLEEPIPLRGAARTAFVLGGKLAHRSRVNLMAELYSTNGLVPIVPTIEASPTGELELPTERRHYLFVGVNKGRLRELPGWKEWDLGLVVLTSLSDHSRMVILDVERRLRLRYAVHGRVSLPAGKNGSAEYGMIPYAAQVSIGFRVQI